MANPYFIKIELPEDKAESAMAGVGSASTGGSNDNAISPGMDKILNKAKQMVSFSTVKSTADQIINYQISTISLQTGATEYEQRMSTVYSIASQAVGAGAALISAGTASGPAGIVVAAMGMAASGISKLIEIEQKRNTLRLKESVENVSIGMQNVRAGVAGRRSGTQ